MRQGNSNDIEQQKKIARLKYANRQIDKFIKASLNNKGYLKFRDLVEVQDNFNIKVHG